ALLDDNSVKCWGENSSGELGLGDGTRRGRSPGDMGDALPVVNLGTNAVAKSLSLGAEHTCALLSDGHIKCWGRNDSGELGQGQPYGRGRSAGQMGDALDVVQLGTGRSAKLIAAGAHHTCAALDDDTLKCWGQNADGQLGLGSTAARGKQAGEMGDSL